MLGNIADDNERKSMGPILATFPAALYSPTERLSFISAFTISKSMLLNNVYNIEEVMSGMESNNKLLQLRNESFVFSICEYTLAIIRETILAITYPNMAPVIPKPKKTKRKTKNIRKRE